MEGALEALAEHGLAWVGLALLVLLLPSHEASRLIARWHRPDVGVPERLSVTVGGMLALVGFMLAVTFTIADDRFEARPVLVLQEANAISTAWLRAGAVGGAEGQAVQRLLVEYTGMRASYTRAEAEERREAALLDRTHALQADIWTHAAAVARREPHALSVALLSSLNEAFDSATAQQHAYESWVPPKVKSLLFLGSLIAAAELGYLIGRADERHRLATTVLMLLCPGAMMLIIDLNRPRQGSVRPDASLLAWTLRGMGALE